MTHPTHTVDAALLQRRVHIHLAGVGGNGAQMAACLARLDIAMRALGHPYGLMVQAFDPDKVNEANLGRQLFSQSDVGLHKSLITITRLNLFYGLDWEAWPCRIEQHWQQRMTGGYLADVLISCVDTRAARRTMHEYLFAGNRYRYWLDLGNRSHDGQVVLGQPGKEHGATRLPCVTELYPELLDVSADEDARPSCSARMSLEAQGLFTNDIVVRYGVQLLFELLSTGGLCQHGVVCNLASKRSAPICAAVDGSSAN
ncbi:PRTRC system ThiF family protein [Duganella sp. FT92W]|uniref:PRTRC system ThiF family protein n=1 Tax=Pseudoduganella rivuli TaxID=2666085 RepID=A0A7X2IJE5_9BURK|nr:PRTRC system ThiF family protein [Pseudoduganella rivuli]MRV70598.1 PRTRC system ThiF family protein [Pseudoduganella rivuli]